MIDLTTLFLIAAALAAFAQVTRGLIRRPGWLPLELAGVAALVVMGAASVRILLVGGGSGPSWDWFSVGGAPLRFSFEVDELTAIIGLVAAFIGGLAILASRRSRPRVVALAALAALVAAAGNFPTALFFLLLQTMLCAPARRGPGEGGDAFASRLIGDLAFGVALALLFRYLGTLDFAAMREANLGDSHRMRDPVGFLAFRRSTTIGLFLLLGVAARSGLLPFAFAILPREGFSVSRVVALTTIGPGLGSFVLLARLGFVLDRSPTAAIVFTVFAALTALLAAGASLGAQRMGRALAWLAASQIGLALIAAGVGTFSVAFAQLFAMAPALAAAHFASDGIRRHAASDRLEDLARAGGRFRRARLAFLLAAMSLAGLPPLIGAIAQDEILNVAVATELGHGWLLWILGAATIFLNAVAMGRLFITVFVGRRQKSDVPDDRPRPVSRSLEVAAILGAIAAIGAIPLMLPSWLSELQGLFRTIAPLVDVEVAAVKKGNVSEVAFAVLGAMISVAGVFAAYHAYIKDPSLPGRLAKRHASVARFFSNEFELARVREAFVVGPLLGFGERYSVRFVDRFLARDGVARIRDSLLAMGERVSSLSSVSLRVAIAVTLGGLLIALLSLATGAPGS